MYSFDLTISQKACEDMALPFKKAISAKICLKKPLPESPIGFTKAQLKPLTSRQFFFGGMQ